MKSGTRALLTGHYKIGKNSGAFNRINKNILKDLYYIK